MPLHFCPARLYTLPTAQTSAMFFLKQTQFVLALIKFDVMDQLPSEGNKCFYSGDKV